MKLWRCSLSWLLIMMLLAPIGLAERTVDEIIAQMTIEQKVYQMFMVKPEAITGASNVTRAGDATKAALEQYPVGGLIYFAANLETIDQTSDMLHNTQQYASEIGMPGLFLGVDEEGGVVARCASKLGTAKFPSMMNYAKDKEPEAVYDAYAAIGKDLSTLGFNLDFAPVADVITNKNNTEIGNRAFGTDPEFVAARVQQAAKGLRDQGLVAVLKHFPGHGNTSVDSHYATSTTNRTLDQMRELELIPFEAGIEAGAPMVLISHLTATAIDDSAPASLNGAIVDGILRNELGFTGVVITDALNMKAISAEYSPEQVAKMAVSAGVDILLMPEKFQATSQALIELVKSGEISEARLDQSVMRILSLKMRSNLLR